MYNSSSLKNITPEHTFEHFSFDLYDDSYVDPITGKTPLASAKNAFDKADHGDHRDRAVYQHVRQAAGQTVQNLRHSGSPFARSYPYCNGWCAKMQRNC